MLCTFSSCIKRGLLSSCHVWTSHCGGSSCCGVWALECTGSVVVVHGIICPMACGIFSEQGLNLCALHWQILNYRTTREVPYYMHFNKHLFVHSANVCCASHSWRHLGFSSEQNKHGPFPLREGEGRECKISTKLDFKARQRMRWLDGITNSTDMSFEQAPEVGDGRGSLACCSPWGRKESDMTE